MTDMERKQCGGDLKQLFLNFGEGPTCGGCGCGKSATTSDEAAQAREKSEKLFQDACQDLNLED